MPAEYVRLGDEFRVNSSTLYNQNQPTIAALPSGGFVVSWVDQSREGGDSSGTSIKAQIYDASGNPVGLELLVNTATLSEQQAPAITWLESGGFVVSWTDYSGEGGDTSPWSIKAQIFDASGNKVGSEFLVNTATASGQTNPAVTSLGSGGFVVSWADVSGEGGDATGSAIKAQIFDASGNKAGSEFLVNTTTTAAQTNPTVTSLGSGGFVVG